MNKPANDEAQGAGVLGFILIIGLPLILAYCAFGGPSVSVPSYAVDSCKNAAANAGFGRCSAVSGRENNSGVYQVELECSRTRAFCQGRENFSVSKWSSFTDMLMHRN